MARAASESSRGTNGQQTDGNSGGWGGGSVRGSVGGYSPVLGGALESLGAPSNPGRSRSVRHGEDGWMTKEKEKPSAWSWFLIGS